MAEMSFSLGSPVARQEWPESYRRGAGAEASPWTSLLLSPSVSGAQVLKLACQSESWLWKGAAVAVPPRPPRTEGAVRRGDTGEEVPSQG